MLTQQFARFRLPLIWGVALSLSACSLNPAGDYDSESDSDEIASPSRSEAQKLVQDYFNAHADCAPFFELPRTVDATNSIERGKMQAFVDAGLLRIETPSISPDSPSEATPTVQYAVTPMGAHHIGAGEGVYDSFKSVICYGHRQISNVEVQEPDIHGSVDVKYHYRFSNTPAWTTSAAIKKQYPVFAKWMTQEEESRETLKHKDGEWSVKPPRGIEMFDFIQYSH